MNHPHLLVATLCSSFSIKNDYLLLITIWQKSRTFSVTTSLYMYPLVNRHSNGIYPFSIGNTSSKGPFSIAMLVYQRVTKQTLKQTPFLSSHHSTQVTTTPARQYYLHTRWTSLTSESSGPSQDEQKCAQCRQMGIIIL